MSNKKLVLIFNGPPGCGKGTIIRKLQESGFDFLLLPMSPLLMELSKHPQKGPRIISAISSGDLVPDDIAIPVFLEAWDKIHCHGMRNLVLDGVVRTEDQAQEVFWKIQMSGQYEVFQIVVDVPLDICRQRMLSVRKRGDDRPEVVEKRFSVYTEKTIPAIERMSSFFIGRTLHLNNDRDPDITVNELKGILDKSLKKSTEILSGEALRFKKEADRMGFTG